MNPVLYAALAKKRRLRADDMPEFSDAQSADNSDTLDAVASKQFPEVEDLAPKPPPARVPFSPDLQPETSDAPQPTGAGLLARDPAPVQDFASYTPPEPVAPAKKDWGNQVPAALSPEAPKTPDYLGDVSTYTPPKSTDVSQTPMRQQLAQALGARLGQTSMARTAAPSSAPLTDEQQMAAADATDRRNAMLQGFELAGKQAIAGLSRTPVAELSAAAPSQRAALMQALAQKRQAENEKFNRDNVVADNLRADKAAALAAQKAAADEEERKRKAAREGDKDAADSDFRERKLKQDAAHDAATLAMAQAGLGIKSKEEERAARKEEKGQTLPASTVTELAGLPAAERQVDELVADFKRLGMGGAAGRAGATVTDALKLQGTDAAEYQASARRAMQAAGTILEGGKLAAGDELKYQRMLPQAGDSEAVVKQKAEGLKQFLRELASGRIQSLQKAGYNAPSDLVGGVAKAPVQPPPVGSVRVKDLETGLELELSPAAAKKMVADKRAVPL